MPAGILIQVIFVRRIRADKTPHRVEYSNKPPCRWHTAATGA